VFFEIFKYEPRVIAAFEVTSMTEKELEIIEFMLGMNQDEN
jgi:hypothetical protein